MPRGQYDREAARAKREAETSNGKSQQITLGMIDYLQETFDVEITPEDAISLYEVVHGALTDT